MRKRNLNNPWQNIANNFSSSKYKFQLAKVVRRQISNSKVRGSNPAPAKKKKRNWDPYAVATNLFCLDL